MLLDFIGVVSHELERHVGRNVIKTYLYDLTIQREQVCARECRYQRYLAVDARIDTTPGERNWLCVGLAARAPVAP